MTLREIAQEFQVSPEAARLWVTRGGLPASRAGSTGKWLARRRDVLDFLAVDSPAATQRAPEPESEPRRWPPVPGSRLTGQPAGLAEPSGG